MRARDNFPGEMAPAYPVGMPVSDRFWHARARLCLRHPSAIVRRIALGTRALPTRRHSGHWNVGTDRRMLGQEFQPFLPSCSYVLMFLGG